jgi:AAA+ superfamily predicted ATPase
VHPALASSFELIKSHYISLEKADGWVNDHTRKKGIVESWATAIVLTFLIHYHDALQLKLQHDILSKYQPIVDVRYAPNIGNQYAWPDLIPVLRSNSIIDSRVIEELSDPSDNERIKRGIETELLRPIEQSWIHRPKNSSLILYGPPGTRKTSLAIGMGRSIRWPIIILSPPLFLRKAGLEGFEASADEIFSDLARLRRIVVLFDECEEFFKKRVENDQPGSRTSGAFITAGMLPRLQMLREKRWLIFILGTNSALTDLDEAVRRQGRFDLAAEIHHPVLSAQLKYVERKLPDAELSTLVKRILKNNVEKRVDSVEIKPVSFSLIDELIRESKHKKLEGKDVKEDELNAFLIDRLTHPGPKRL